MHMSEIKKDMLGGKNGRACEFAMNILFELGESYDAKRMISGSQMHIDFTLNMVDAGVEFAEKKAESGARFAVPTQLNPASIDLLHQERMRVPEHLLEKTGCLKLHT
jgi:predicted aconitase